MDKIETVEDQNKLIFRNSIQYLDNLTKMKELNIPTIKSLYRTKCRLMELRQHIFLPPQKPYHRCQRCFMYFSEGNTKFEVLPVKLSCFAKKVVSKVQKNLLLTTYQKVYYKKLLKKFPNGFQNQNKMVLTCSYCQKETEVRMNKPKKEKDVAKIDKTPVKKKKSKKKDKFCGLNESVVILSSTKMKTSSTLKDSNANNNIKDNLNNNQKTALLNTTNNAFVRRENTNINTSVSVVHTRDFQTSDFISLESNSNRRRNMKLSRKKPGDSMKISAPVISKSKQRLREKKINSLSSMLKNSKVTQNKSSASSKLKAFLDSL